MEEIIGQILNIIPSIFQGITGASQLKRARKIEEQYPHPEAVVAPSIDKLVRYAYGQTLAQDIPGGELYRGEIKGATASGIRAASELGSGAEAYGMLGKLVGGEQSAMSGLAKILAQQIAGYKKDYMGTLPLRAEEETRVWNWNEAQPYLQAQQIAQQLRYSGLGNIFSGMKNVFGSTAEFVNPELTSSLLWGEGNNERGFNVTMAEILKYLKENE